MERQVAFPEYPEKPAHGHAHSHSGHFGDNLGLPNRKRGKSLSEQTTEVAKHLAPPISWSLVALCLLWYLTSAVSNTIAKSILNIASYPTTLTMIQFLYAMLFSSLALEACRKFPDLAAPFPRGTLSSAGVQHLNRQIFAATAPMAMFQLVGHLFSYTAMSQIPVSLVHAIKSLSPLFTVLAYAAIFHTRHKTTTYLALFPLTLGVIMTCAAEFRARPLAIGEALCSTLIFVAQNMYSKQLLTPGTAANTPKFDKMTILGWCAALAFVTSLPIWLCTDGFRFLTRGIEIKGSGWYLIYLFTLNGLSHTCQNLLSFLVLGSISPVSYSVASLVKRIVVISASIVWFGQKVSSQQSWGILISFFGLYIYDRFGGKVETRSTLPT